MLKTEMQAMAAALASALTTANLPARVYTDPAKAARALASGRDALIVTIPDAELETWTVTSWTHEIWAIAAATDPATAIDRLDAILTAVIDGDTTCPDQARPDTFTMPGGVALPGLVLTITT